MESKFVIGGIFILVLLTFLVWHKIDSWMRPSKPRVTSSNVISINSEGVPVKHEKKVEVRYDSYGRVCRRPDPMDNEAFRTYAQVHGIRAARAAWALWEDDEYG